MDLNLPLVVEPKQLQEVISADNLLIIDVSRKDVYAQYHLPGALHLEYQELLYNNPPTVGLLPNELQLSQLFSRYGLNKASHVVAYDDEGGGKACRLLWTLDAIGYRNASLLNGGLHALVNEGFPLDNQVVAPTPAPFEVQFDQEPIADQAYLLAHLEDPGVALLDVRTPLEFQGKQRCALRSGHIPGAVNFEWTQALDRTRNLRLKSAKDLRTQLAALTITPDKEIITYCQTHHRSSHTYQVLKWLGFPRVKGYPGSWSEWGNQQDTPIET